MAHSDPRWSAVLTHDRRADGSFYYSVSTTGVYCRPSCGSRRPKREHVRFHATAADAEHAGFRPCRRCRPNGASLAELHAEKIARACRLIERAQQAPTLAALAQEAGLSPYHFHRVFKGVTGVTPREYAAAHRNNRVRRQLQNRGKTVTEAIYDSGFNSGGRFYETSNARLGMTPTEFRTGGPDMTIQFAVGECSLGSVLVARTTKGVCAILLGEDPDALVRDLQDRFPRATLVGGDKQFEQTVAQVIGFLEQPAGAFELPLDVRGTAFQQRVWQALTKVPVGTTISYSQLARRIGAAKSARAVAAACAANALAVAIPCHRVVRTDGSLSGYRWGVERKATLLAREAHRRPGGQ